MGSAYVPTQRFTAIDVGAAVGNKAVIMVDGKVYANGYYITYGSSSRRVSAAIKDSRVFVLVHTIVVQDEVPPLALTVEVLNYD